MTLWQVLAVKEQEILAKFSLKEDRPKPKLECFYFSKLLLLMLLDLSIFFCILLSLVDDSLSLNLVLLGLLGDVKLVEMSGVQLIL